MKVAVLIVLVAAAYAEEYYTTGDDYIDVPALLADPARVHDFIDCYLDKAPCAELPASFKKIIPEAVEQACKKCNDQQRHIFWEFLKGLKVSYPEEYESLLQKYDPEQKYFLALEKVISKY